MHYVSVEALTEIVLLAWRLVIKIEEIPVQILELRNTSVTVLRRVPKVLNTVRALRDSLIRFPRLHSQLPDGLGKARRADRGL